VFSSPRIDVLRGAAANARNRYSHGARSAISGCGRSRYRSYRTAHIWGAILGLAGALAATQILETSLYEVKPHDPQTYLLIAVILAAVALLASYIPARLASAVDPAITLRAE
jgi:uncharacterized membrane protein YeaQ/YmgE (transglycosylase-associated protein family)